jgi:hypothetical protein
MPKLPKRFSADLRDSETKILAWVTAVRLDLLRRPQSFRSAPFPSLSPFYPPSSSECDGGVEIRHIRCLKIDRGRTVASIAS